MIFGQIIVGPPGSGKSTYCLAVKQFLEATGRPIATFNLDPANDSPPFAYDVDISELITLDDAMDAFRLGPNGGLMYCIEYLEKNTDWLQDKLQAHEESYVLLDCPGQAEMYTHHSSIFSIISSLTRPLDLRLAAVHLVDASHCTDPQKYLSAVLLSVNTMMRLELPAVNVLSKVDLITKNTEQHGEHAHSDDAGEGTEQAPAHLFRDGLLFDLEWYQAAGDLHHLLQAWDLQLKKALPDETEEQQPGGAAAPAAGAGGRRLTGAQYARRWRERTMRLYGKLAEVIEDYSLVGFRLLSVQDRELMAGLVKQLDGAIGYAYGALGEQQRLARMAKEQGGQGGGAVAEPVDI